MDHLTEPLDELRAEAVAFLWEPASQVLHLEIDEPLFSPALDVLAALEWQPDVNRYVVVLQERVPAATPEARWHAWAGLIEDEDVHLRSMQREPDGSLQPPLSFAPEVPALTIFTGRLLGLLAATTSPDVRASGLAVVLVPATPLTTTPDVAAIRGLVKAVEASKIKWIIAERDKGSLKPLRTGIAEHMRTAQCRIDPERQCAELAEMLDSYAVAPGAGRRGCAWPTAPAPPHPSEPPTRHVGEQGDLSFDPAPTLARALSALRSNDRDAAIETIRAGQAEARQAGQIGLAVDLGLFLGVQVAESLFNARADISPALGIVETSARHARAAGLHGVAAKCGLVAGAIATRAKSYVRAAESLGRGASDAKGGGNAALAVEALYLGGELSASAAESLGQHQLREVARDLWQEALRVAGALPPGAATPRAEDCARRISEMASRRNHQSRPPMENRGSSASSPALPPKPGRSSGD